MARKQAAGVSLVPRGDTEDEDEDDWGRGEGKATDPLRSAESRDGGS